MAELRELLRLTQRVQGHSVPTGTAPSESILTFTPVNRWDARGSGNLLEVFKTSYFAFMNLAFSLQYTKTAVGRVMGMQGVFIHLLVL